MYSFDTIIGLSLALKYKSSEYESADAHFDEVHEVRLKINAVINM